MDFGHTAVAEYSVGNVGKQRTCVSFKKFFFFLRFWLSIDEGDVAANIYSRVDCLPCKPKSTITKGHPNCL